jgi:hypothetical protein
MSGGVTYVNHSHSAQQQNLTPPSPVPTVPNLLSAETRQMYQQDCIDRDRQASSLAAAGKAAETINHNNSTSNQQTLQSGSLLIQAPTSLGPGLAQTDNGIMATPTTSDLDALNWNLMDLGGPQFDDMDLDFATMFDPANELSQIHSNGNGWQSSFSATQGAPMPQISSTTQSASTTVSYPTVGSDGQRNG